MVRVTQKMLDAKLARLNALSRRKYVFKSSGRRLILSVKKTKNKPSKTIYGLANKVEMYETIDAMTRFKSSEKRKRSK